MTRIVVYGIAALAAASLAGSIPLDPCDCVTTAQHTDWYTPGDTFPVRTVVTVNSNVIEVIADDERDVSIMHKKLQRLCAARFAHLYPEFCEYPKANSDSGNITSWPSEQPMASTTISGEVSTRPLTPPRVFPVPVPTTDVISAAPTPVKTTAQDSPPRESPVPVPTTDAISAAPTSVETSIPYTPPRESPAPVPATDAISTISTSIEVTISYTPAWWPPVPVPATDAISAAPTSIETIIQSMPPQDSPVPVSTTDTTSLVPASVETTIPHTPPQESSVPVSTTDTTNLVPTSIETTLPHTPPQDSPVPVSTTDTASVVTNSAETTMPPKLPQESLVLVSTMDATDVVSTSVGTTMPHSHNPSPKTSEAAASDSWTGPTTSYVGTASRDPEPTSLSSGGSRSDSNISWQTPMSLQGTATNPDKTGAEEAQSSQPIEKPALEYRSTVAFQPTVEISDGESTVGSGVYHSTVETRTQDAIRMSHTPSSSWTSPLVFISRTTSESSSGPVSGENQISQAGEASRRSPEFTELPTPTRQPVKPLPADCTQTVTTILKIGNFRAATVYSTTVTTTSLIQCTCSHLETLVINRSAITRHKPRLTITATGPSTTTLVLCRPTNTEK